MTVFERMNAITQTLDDTVELLRQLVERVDTLCDRVEKIEQSQIGSRTAGRGSEPKTASSTIK